MNPWHDENQVTLSGEPVRLFLRYRLAVIAAFLLAVASAGFVSGASPGGAAPAAVAVQSAR